MVTKTNNRTKVYEGILQTYYTSYLFVQYTDMDHLKLFHAQWT